MKLTVYGKDWLIVDENNLEQVKEEMKVHLIMLNFDNPTHEKINEVLDRFPNTNRYIIDDNIKFYNDALKNIKKYYVMNKVGVGLITHFKKNNKVLLNMNNLSYVERQFVKTNLKDVLKNLEVIYVSDSETLQEDWAQELRYWNGNILVKK